MNIFTAQIIRKGYDSLGQGLIALNMSRRTFYRLSSNNKEKLQRKIDELGSAKDTIVNGKGWMSDY